MSRFGGLALKVVAGPGLTVLELLVGLGIETAKLELGLEGAVLDEKPGFMLETLDLGRSTDECILRSFFGMRSSLPRP